MLETICIILWLVCCLGDFIVHVCNPENSHPIVKWLFGSLMDGVIIFIIYAILHLVIKYW